jgi:hypothetical protein
VITNRTDENIVLANQDTNALFLYPIIENDSLYNCLRRLKFSIQNYESSDKTYFILAPRDTKALFLRSYISGPDF